MVIFILVIFWFVLLYWWCWICMWRNICFSVLLNWVSIGRFVCMDCVVCFM